MDIATLGLAVDSRPVADASKDLDRIREAAAKAERQADSFGKRVETAGRRAAAANDNSARAAQRAARAYEGYSKAATLAARAIGAVAGAAIGSALIRYADAWSDMQSRVGAAIRDMEAAPALMKRIVDIANASYSPLDQTVEIYGRNVAVLRDLGRTAVEAADFTEALNHALVTTATKGQDADVVLNALSRAISIGGLRAMEYETIMSRSPRVLEAIADELGTNVVQLRALAQQGKVTGDVIVTALINNLEKLRAEAAEMPATIGDAFVRIQTNLTAFIGTMDKAAGASEMVATALLSLADNIGRIITYAATAVTMFGTYYVAAFVAARLATVTLTGALTLLRAALIRTGIGALIVGAGELVYQFGRLVEATGSFTGALQEMGRRSELLLDAVVWAFRAAGEAIQAVWAGAMADLLRMTEDAFGGILRTLGVSSESMAASIDRLEKRATALGELSKTSAGIAAEQFKGAFAEITMPGVDIPNTPGVRAPSVDGIDKAAKKAAEAYERIVENAQEFIRAQELEAQAVGMTAQQANALRYEMDLLNEARRAGLNLTDADRAGFRALAEAMAGAEARAESLKEALDFAKDVGKGFIKDFFNGIQQGKSIWESFADAAINALNRIADKLLDMAMDQAIQSLFGNLLGVGGGGFSSGVLANMGTGTGFWAKGGVFDQSGVVPFAKGGIVNRPTVFPFAKGIGLMGEAGPEAIMPLRRNSQGQLGVIAANDRAANQNQRVQVDIAVSVNDDGRLAVIARQAGGEAADVRIRQYDRNLPNRMQQIQADPRAR